MSEDIKTDKPDTFDDWRISPQGLCATNEAVMKSEYYMKGRLQNTNCYAMAYKRMQAHLRAAYDSYLVGWGDRGNE